jgi:cytochrome bd-type quinol oxidase subunit 1
MWIVSTFARMVSIRTFMQTAWGWPAAESVHFIGLSLLVGTIFLFDLRLLGMAKRIPIGALHRLVPWGLLGFGISAASGMLFLIAEPDQYVYNPAFQLKVLFMIVAGFNATAFYLTSYRRSIRRGEGVAPRSAQIIAIVSLCLWISVIVAGRLLTFYRPWPCGPEGPGAIAECLPGYPSDEFAP